MNNQTVVNSGRCPHSALTAPRGLALVTVGNSLRGDDNAAALVCSNLPPDALANTCRFDLGCYTGYIADCLTGHRVGVIVDTMSSNAVMGSYRVVCISGILKESNFGRISPGHAFSWLDELRIAGLSKALPPHLVFFGIEVGAVGWTEKLNPEIEIAVPSLAMALSSTLHRFLEAETSYA